jgi:hypothetical protein
MERRFQLRWDEEELARAFKVTTTDVREYLTDGRRVSFIIERRLMWENPGWRLAPSEGAGYDLLDPDGGMWEVRSITRQGVYFNPSNQVGSGRVFNEEGFQAKLRGIKGFILSDIVRVPGRRCLCRDNGQRAALASRVGARIERESVPRQVLEGAGGGHSPLTNIALDREAQGRPGIPLSATVRDTRKS